MNSRSTDIATGIVDSPLGRIQVQIAGAYLTEIRFIGNREIPPVNSDNPVVTMATNQLREYFEGRRTVFDLPLNPSGSEFQVRVWKSLQSVGFGETVTYGQLAERLGDPDTVRAVGRANGQNPIPVVIPCHRVIGSNGMLVGYSGGIERKEWLLKHEGALLL